MADDLWERALAAADAVGQRRISLGDLWAARELAMKRRLFVQLPIIADATFTTAFYFIKPDGTIDRKMQNPERTDEWITSEMSLSQSDAGPSTN